MKVNSIPNRYHSRIGNPIHPSYDILLDLMMADNLSFSTDESSVNCLLYNVEREAFDTDDFLASTCTELKTKNISSSELKTSSGSAENGEIKTNQKGGSDVSSDDGESANGDIKTSSCNAAETEMQKRNQDDKSETTSDDGKPAAKSYDDHDENKSSTRLGSSIHFPLKQSSQNGESFPCTLRHMLNHESSVGHIKWLEGGDGFEVINQNALEKDILPRYFPSRCLFQSFVRRLYR